MAKLICKFTGTILNENFDTSLLPPNLQSNLQHSVHPIFLLQNKDFIRGYDKSIKSFNTQLAKIFAISAIERMGMIQLDQNSHSQLMTIQIKNGEQFKALLHIFSIYINLSAKDKDMVSRGLPKFRDNVSFSLLANKFQSAFRNLGNNPKIDIYVDQLAGITLEEIQYNDDIASLKNEIDLIVNKPTKSVTAKRSTVKQKRFFSPELFAELDLCHDHIKLVASSYSMKEKDFCNSYTMQDIIEVQNDIHRQISELPNNLLFALTDLDLHLAEILTAYGLKMSAFGLEIQKKTIDRKLSTDKSISFNLISGADLSAPAKPVKRKRTLAEMRIMLNK